MAGFFQFVKRPWKKLDPSRTLNMNLACFRNATLLIFSHRHSEEPKFHLTRASQTLPRKLCQPLPSPTLCRVSSPRTREASTDPLVTQKGRTPLPLYKVLYMLCCSLFVLAYFWLKHCFLSRLPPLYKANFGRFGKLWINWLTLQDCRELCRVLELLHCRSPRNRGFVKPCHFVVHSIGKCGQRRLMMRNSKSVTLQINTNYACGMFIV